jgi:hypothetical protein
MIDDYLDMHNTRYPNCQHFKVPLKATPVKPFKGRMKSDVLSRVRKSIFQKFSKVPAMFKQRQFGKVPLY